MVQSVRSLLNRGGPGSGHFGHEGRPGEVGGSAPGEGRVNAEALTDRLKGYTPTAADVEGLQRWLGEHAQEVSREQGLQHEVWLAPDGTPYNIEKLGHEDTAHRVLIDHYGKAMRPQVREMLEVRPTSVEGLSEVKIKGSDITVGEIQQNAPDSFTYTPEGFAQAMWARYGMDVPEDTSVGEVTVNTADRAFDEAVKVSTPAVFQQEIMGYTPGEDLMAAHGFVRVSRGGLGPRAESVGLLWDAALPPTAEQASFMQEAAIAATGMEGKSGGVVWETVNLSKAHPGGAGIAVEHRGEYWRKFLSALNGNYGEPQGAVVIEARSRWPAWAIDLMTRGGPGSGHHGHLGRPGEVGGSAPGDGMSPGLVKEMGRSAAAEMARKVDAAFKGPSPISAAGYTIWSATAPGETPGAAKIGLGDYWLLRDGTAVAVDDHSVSGMMALEAAYPNHTLPMFGMAESIMVGLGLVRWSSTGMAGVTVGEGKISDEQAGRLSELTALRGEWTVGNLPWSVSSLTVTPLQPGDYPTWKRPEVAYNVDTSHGDFGSGLESLLSQRSLVIRGGPGSGHHGHAGRPGEVGGSAPGEGGQTPPEAKPSGGLKAHLAEGRPGRALTGTLGLTRVIEPADLQPGTVLYQEGTSEEVENELAQRFVNTQKEYQAVFGGVPNVAFTNDAIAIAEAATLAQRVPMNSFENGMTAQGLERGALGAFDHVSGVLWMQDSPGSLRGTVWYGALAHELGHLSVSERGGLIPNIQWPAASLRLISDVEVPERHMASYSVRGYEQSEYQDEYMADLMGAHFSVETGRANDYRFWRTGVEDWDDEDFRNLDTILGILKQPPAAERAVVKEEPEAEERVLVIYPNGGVGGEGKWLPRSQAETDQPYLVRRTTDDEPMAFSLPSTTFGRTERRIGNLHTHVRQRVREIVGEKPVERGGPGSGHFGHEGRPGEVGGSAPSAGGPETGAGPKISQGVAEAKGTYYEKLAESDDLEFEGSSNRSWETLKDTIEGNASKIFPPGDARHIAALISRKATRQGLIEPQQDDGESADDIAQEMANSNREVWETQQVEDLQVRADIFTRNGHMTTDELRQALEIDEEEWQRMGRGGIEAAIYNRVGPEVFGDEWDANSSVNDEDELVEAISDIADTRAGNGDFDPDPSDVRENLPEREGGNEWVRDEPPEGEHYVFGYDSDGDMAGAMQITDAPQDSSEWDNEVRPRLGEGTSDGYLVLHLLSATNGGQAVGSKMMREAFRMASKQDAGVIGSSVDDAMGFYKRLGATFTGRHTSGEGYDFFWSPGAVKEALEMMEKGELPDRSLSGEQPAAMPEIEEESLSIRGGPGSGHFGHEGRPGERGGSAPGAGGAPAGVQPGEPRVYVSEKDALEHGSKSTEWNGKGFSQPSGAPIRGAHIALDDSRIPDTVYHMTTNMRGKEAAGIIRRGGKAKETGLGGDNRDQMVSMTIDETYAKQMASDMRLAATAAAEFAPIQPEHVWDEEHSNWYWQSKDGERLSDQAAEEYATRLTGRISALDETRPESLKFEPYETLPSLNFKDELNRYLQERERASGGTQQNPIIFADAEHLAKIDPANIGYIAIPKANLGTGALLTNFDLDNRFGLKEIRIYGDLLLEDAQFHWGPGTVERGGPGSGHFGHEGRPGEVGGSAAGAGQQAEGEPLAKQEQSEWTQTRGEYATRLHEKYGAATWDDWTNAIWVGPDGKLLAPLEDHQETAMELLGWGKGVERTSEEWMDLSRQATDRIVESGLIRYNATDRELFLDIPSIDEVTDEQWTAMSAMATRLAEESGYWPYIALNIGGPFGEHGPGDILSTLDAYDYLGIGDERPDRPFVGRGGPGSGYFGHEGRPGEVGGSTPGGGLSGTEEAYTRVRGSASSLADHDRWLKEAELPPRQETIQEAVDEFGLTDEPTAAGYLLPDGSYLDFARGDHERYINHDEISGPTGLSITQFMLVTGAIRVAAYGNLEHDDAGLMLEFTRGAPVPTNQQWRSISRIPAQSAEIDVSSSTGGYMKGVSVSHPEGVDASRQRRFVENLMLSEEPIALAASIIRMVLRGGPGSGHFGHEGRPGEVGGSAAGAGQQAATTTAAGATPRPFTDRHLPQSYLRALPEAIKHTRFSEVIPASGVLGHIQSLFLTPDGTLVLSHAEHRDVAAEAAQAVQATDILTPEERKDVEKQEWLDSVMASGVHRLTVDGRTFKDAAYVAYQADTKVTQAQWDTAQEIAIIIKYPFDNWRFETFTKPGTEKEAQRAIGLTERGGPGSGHFGHEGRPGEVGGSAAGAGGKEAGPRIQEGRLTPAGRMSIKEKYGEQVATLAEQRFESAAEAVSDMTDTVQGLTEITGGKMAGLEFRLKSEESLARKIASISEEMHITPQEALDQINDTVRYTVLFEPEEFVGSVLAVQEQLEAEGWEQWDTTWRNYFAPGDDYDGYNTVLANKETGQRFELQFHTPKSYEIKHESWSIYNRWRNTHEDGPVRAQLSAEMQSLWKQEYGRPVGWENLRGIRMDRMAEASVAA